MNTPLQELLEKHTIPAAKALVRPEPKGALRCLACGHRCLVREGRAGICRVRFNRHGELRVPGGYVAGLQVDPIEKKPFYHAFPGRDALSFGMLGCDLHCPYCQNWVSSQILRDDEAVAYPRFYEEAQLVEMALNEKAPVIVSTYNEPLITADWAARIFELACAQGMTCGFVSNGNATPEVLNFLKPWVSLYKVDLKSFKDDSYRQLGCKRSNVLESIEQLKSMGFWIEIVTLVVPGFNDTDQELAEMARFIAALSPEIPWHVTAFHPDYKMQRPQPTSASDLDRAYHAGKSAGLHHVYAGNRPGAVGDRENTFCPGCQAVLIKRYGYHILENRMNGNTCPECCCSIAGVWESNPPRHGVGSGMPRPVSR